MEPYLIKGYEVEGYEITVQVIHDEFAERPYETGDAIEISTFESLYIVDSFLEEHGISKRKFNLMLQGKPTVRNGKIYLTLERYSHGLDVYALSHEGNFVDRRWDVAQGAGLISLNLKEWGQKSMASAKVKRIMRDAIEHFNRWCSGDCWGYETRIISPSGEEYEDSCWGFVMDAPEVLEYAVQEAMAYVNHQLEKDHESECRL